MAASTPIYPPKVNGQRNGIPRPFLKWAGGKTNLLSMLLAYCPQKFNTYYEPFLGGGALFFGLYRLGKIHYAKLSDINEELISTYNAIKNNVESVIKILEQYPHEKDFYYSLRSKDPNLLSIEERAARMIYLNKTGYNGLYRVNSKGKFNVPFGRYKNPNYKDFDNLRAVSVALQHVQLSHHSFEMAISTAQKGDFVYFDPPYDPVSETAYFTQYNASGFGKNEQRKLAETFWNLGDRGVYVMLSNSNTEFIRELYKGATIIELIAPRFINSNAARRTGHTELLILNYHLKDAGIFCEPAVNYNSNGSI